MSEIERIFTDADIDDETMSMFPQSYRKGNWQFKSKTKMSENPTKVIYTGSIPQCPHCKKPTVRTEGMSMTTCMYFQPVYNEQGENTNPDRNTTTTDWHCNSCGNTYVVSGNDTDGYKYS